MQSLAVSSCRAIQHAWQGLKNIGMLGVLFRSATGMGVLQVSRPMRWLAWLDCMGKGLWSSSHDRPHCPYP